jgi:hypothetical protein
VKPLIEAFAWMAIGGIDAALEYLGDRSIHDDPQGPHFCDAEHVL